MFILCGVLVNLRPTPLHNHSILAFARSAEEFIVFYVIAGYSPDEYKEEVCIVPSDEKEWTVATQALGGTPALRGIMPSTLVSPLLHFVTFYRIILECNLLIVSV